MGREDQGVAKSKHRYQVIPRTLCFITYGDEVLLLRGGPHKRLWAGRYNGVGGHIEAGEDVHAATLREIDEETGLTVHDLRLAASSTPMPATRRSASCSSCSRRRPRARRSASRLRARWNGGRSIGCRQRRWSRICRCSCRRRWRCKPAEPPFFAAYRYDEHDRLVMSFAEPR